MRQKSDISRDSWVNSWLKNLEYMDNISKYEPEWQDERVIFFIGSFWLRKNLIICLIVDESSKSLPSTIVTTFSKCSSQFSRQSKSANHFRIYRNQNNWWSDRWQNATTVIWHSLKKNDILLEFDHSKPNFQSFFQNSSFVQWLIYPVSCSHQQQNFIRAYLSDRKSFILCYICCVSNDQFFLSVNHHSIWFAYPCFWINLTKWAYLDLDLYRTRMIETLFKSHQKNMW